MFDIGWTEMAVIALVVIIFIGPKELPGVLRTLGQWVSKARAMAREFQDGLEDMVRETGLDEAKREIESATGDIGGMIEKSIDPGAELKGAFDPDYRSPEEAEDEALPAEAETSTAEDEIEAGAEADAGTKTEASAAEDEEPEDKESQADEHRVPAKGGG
ncbi:MAG: Sec-independent protein translocase protein TatB [Alphaproteobacteria bacterium]